MRLWVPNTVLSRGNLNTANAVWATRVLDDTNYVYSSGDIAEVNATEDMYGEYLGNYKLTYYCSCELCCDVETGITATGTPVVEGQTIAVDPNVIPYGTQVYYQWSCIYRRGLWRSDRGQPDRYLRQRP